MAKRTTEGKPPMTRIDVITGGTYLTRKWAYAEWADRITSTVTAFPTWAKLMQACLLGYCPTIKPDTRRRRQLIRLLHAAGLSYWHDGKTLAFPVPEGWLSVQS